MIDRSYHIESLNDFLLLGDIMAILAECQNRQECGVDRWWGVTHERCRFGVGETIAEMQPVIDRMDDDVSIKVAVGFNFTMCEYPAFSLRRIHPSPQLGPTLGPTQRYKFLHEMILHRMIDEHGEHVWEGIQKFGYRGKGITRPWVCQDREYQANLLVVKEYQEGYLEACSDIYRLLSEV
jgi:hypothetical protein